MMIHPIAKGIEMKDGKPFITLDGEVVSAPENPASTSFNPLFLDQQMISPNAIDLRLDKVFEFVQGSQQFTLTADDHKTHTVKVEIPAVNDWWWLKRGKSYEVVFQGDIKMGEEEAGLIIPRSSLNRNSVILTSGLYDSGYEGVLASMLHTNMVNFSVMKGARLGQLVIWKAETAHTYNGSYGAKSEHDQQLYGN